MITSQSIDYTHFLSLFESNKSGLSDVSSSTEDVDEDTALALHYAKYLEGYWDFSGIIPVFKIRFSGRAFQ